MGDIWKFSDKIDEEDLAFAAHDYVTYEMAVQYYGLGFWTCNSSCYYQAYDQ